jgi:hypothetical protein
MRSAIAADSSLQRQLKRDKAIGEDLLVKPPDSYRIGGQEHTLLAVSRDVEGRVFLLAGLYKLTGDRRFARRAVREMVAAAAFPDWYPTHFLDTAEMTTALGIGYDWLYPTISAANRVTIHNAIVSKGITPWLTILRANKFHNGNNNWVQVCYGGETVGALAVADSPADLDRAREVVGYARPAIARIMKLFAPDGGFEEGPVYWNYATTYNVLYIAALDSSLGTDFGAATSAGFSATPNYRIQSIGPLFKYANFGDAEPDAFPAPQMFWFASRFRNSGYAASERTLSRTLTNHIDGIALGESSRFAILGLLWDALLPADVDPPAPPLEASFARIAQAYMRSAWNDPDAWYVGFKGGDSHASHGHLDLGSFVLDAFDRRWALDLGKDNYGLPGYFKPQRWTYYRMRTEGHNTLTVDGQNEDLDAHAPLLATSDEARNLFAIADLDHAYKGKLQHWERGISIIDGRSVLVQDEIIPARPVDVIWNFHTGASIHIAADGRSAKLTQEGAALEARILSPADARFQTASTRVSPPQASNKGISNLVIRLPQVMSAQKIIVLFTRAADKFTPDILPLSAWKADPLEQRSLGTGLTGNSQ